MANAVSNVGFSSPGFDYGADIADTERKRALAQALQNQSLQNEGGTQVINGWAVPQRMNFNKLGEALVGGYGQKKASEDQRALAEKSQAEYRQMLATGLKQLQGSPATGQAEDASGNVTPPQAAVAPDPMSAMGTFGSHPMGAQFMPLAMQQMQRQQWLNSMQPQGGTQPQQPSPMNPGGPNPSVMAGSGPNPTLPPSATPAPNQGQTGVGGAAAGIPMNAWLTAPPEAKAYLEALAKERAPVNVREGGAVYVPGQNAPMFQNFKTQPGQMIDYSGGRPAMNMVPGFQQTQTGINSIPNPSAPMTKLPTSSGQEIMLTQPEMVQWQQTGELPTRYGGKPPSSALSPSGGGRGGGYGGGGLPSAPSTTQPKAGGLGTVGASQSQQDIINQARQTAGGKAVDEQFAKDYVTFTQGGAQDAAKQLSQLRDVSTALKDPKANLTGPYIGNVPDSVKAFTNPQSVAMKERVEEVVQRSLRAILGAQFTEKEGERLIARAYNPRLSESENGIRVDRLLTQLDGAFRSKMDASRYFEKNGTLEGWRGKMPSMGDFDPESKTGAAAKNATIKWSDLP